MNDWVGPDMVPSVEGGRRSAVGGGTACLAPTLSPAGCRLLDARPRPRLAFVGPVCETIPKSSARKVKVQAPWASLTICKHLAERARHLSRDARCRTRGDGARIQTMGE